MAASSGDDYGRVLSPAEQDASITQAQQWLKDNPVSSKMPIISPASNLESPADYWNRVGLTDNNKSSTSPALESPQSYFARLSALQPPLQNPGQAGSTAAGNYTSAMPNLGFMPTQDEASKSFNETQNQTYGSNLALQRDAYNRSQQAVIEQQQQKANFAREQGFDTSSPKALPPEQKVQTSKWGIAMDALDNVEEDWRNAAQVDPNNPTVSKNGITFGDSKVPSFLRNAAGGLIQKQDPRISAWDESNGLATSSVLNGVLGYTPGAEGKMSMQDIAHDLLPNESDTPIMAFQKLSRLRMRVMSDAVNSRDAWAQPGQDTSAMDRFIGRNYSKVAQYKQWADAISNPNPGANGAALSPIGQANLDRANGKPVQSPISQYSPAGGSTPIQPATSPTKDSLNSYDAIHDAKIAASKAAIGGALKKVGDAWNGIFPENWAVNQKEVGPENR